MKKVSFDFDGTLSKNKVQLYAKMLIKADVECWIVTSRMGFGKEPTPTWNDDLFAVAKEIGIPNNQIHFCCMDNKANFLNGKGFIWLQIRLHFYLTTCVFYSTRPVFKQMLFYKHTH